MLQAAELNDPSATRLQQLKKRFAAINRLFLAAVVLPTTLATIYFGFIASDVYISESRFVVRTPQRQAPSGLGVLLQNAGFSRSQDDTYTVHDFMNSRDALQKINQQIPLHKTFTDQRIDLFNRFNGFGLDDSFESLYLYYQKHITLVLDPMSSISTLNIRAFSADDAYRVNEMLLQMGENLINQLNERGRQDMIRFAKAEVDAAEQKAKDAALALSSYRTHNAVFDPERQSALQLQQVSKLQDELITTTTQLAQVRGFTPDNPQIPALQKRVQTLEAEITTAMAKVTGGSASLTNKVAEYERLVLERALTDKQLAAALASLEQARNDAQRKQLYLERIVQPNKPDVAVEPRRLRSVLATLVLGLILWGVLSLLIAGVREHKD
jgi:capsular polysaccharide transport system permease protein